MTPKIGKQTPTTSLIIPYSQTKGQEAIDLYEKTGRKAMEWQKIQIYDIMAYDDDGLWVHSKYGYAVPRRNGKTEDALMRIMWGLVNGEKILYTAHLISTAHSVWETLIYLLDEAEINYSSVKAKGQENIRLLNGDKPYILDHCINFRTRSNTGGLGEGYDLLIIDEAQEYTTDQESALKYVISASQNPQTIMMGTPPTTNSKGTVFSKMRDHVLSGDSKYTGWAEWSVGSLHDPSDREAWYLTNPSLGLRLTERSIENENTTDDIDFNVQRLGHWLAYSQQSAITEREWKNLKMQALPKFIGKLSVGIKFGKDGNNIAMSVAVKTSDGKIFVECIDCQSIRNGYLWIVDFIKNADIKSVVIDGAGAQNVLSSELIDYGIKKQKLILPTVKEVITANSLFEKAVLSDKSIEHNCQPSVVDVISNCQKRAIRSDGGFGYKSIDDRREIAIMDSIILAHWNCMTSKKRNIKQKIRY